jgi:hypothetical protein
VRKNKGPLVGYYATKGGLLIVAHGKLSGVLRYILGYCGLSLGTQGRSLSEHIFILFFRFIKFT